MPLSNFPQGVSSFGLPLVGSGPILTTGNVFFVNSSAVNASNGNVGTSPDKPLATIDYAVGLCTANNGDTILVHPNHTESITSTGGLALDVAGISVIGIPSGARKPELACSTSTSARITCSAANVRLQGFLITGNIDAATIILSVSGADFQLYNCEYRDASGTQCGTFLQTTAGATRMHVKNFVYRGDASAGTARAFGLTGTTDMKIEDFDIVGNFSAAAINIVTTLTANLIVRRGFIKNLNASDGCITDTITGSTGWIGPELYFDLADDAANVTEAVTGATFRLFGPVKVVNADNQQGFDINWTVTADA